MTDPEFSLRKLHEQFCTLTGRRLNYSFYQREWRDFAQHFTADDLAATLAWIAKENSKREKRYAIRTELLRLIGDLAVFDSLKAEAELAGKALAAKKRQIQPAQSAIELATMRHEPLPTGPDAPVKRVSAEVIADAILKGGKG